MLDQDRRIHPSPFPDWYASQDTSARGVWIHDMTSEVKVKPESPAEWGGTGRGTSLRMARACTSDGPTFRNGATSASGRFRISAQITKQNRVWRQLWHQAE